MMSTTGPAARKSGLIPRQRLAEPRSHPEGRAGHIRSDNGPEFVAKAVQQWITAVGAKTAYIAPRSPWENGYVESFNARLRDELLDGEIFYTLREAQIIIESWRWSDGSGPEMRAHKPASPQELQKIPRRVGTCGDSYR
jgi:transposase InsO family protein